MCVRACVVCVLTPADPVGQVGVKLQHTSAAPVSRCTGTALSGRTHHEGRDKDERSEAAVLPGHVTTPAYVLVSTAPLFPHW